jgi:preprotein translocase subunit Sec63
MSAAATEETFDPYGVLGLAPDASTADIEAAYTAARSKFDLDLVADLGSELQEHFKRKAQAVERAYETLIASRPE